MSCRFIGNAIVCGPSNVEVLSSESVGVKWCFVCRKRVEFTDEMHGEPRPTYYDPWPVRQCANGHIDGDVFPGRIREWVG